MITFLLAVSFVFFFRTSLVTRIVVGAVYACLMLVCALLLYICWGQSRLERPLTSKKHRQTKNPRKFVGKHLTKVSTLVSIRRATQPSPDIP